MSSIRSLALMNQTQLSQNQRQNMFSRVDANSDGSVTKDEFVAARPKQVSETKAAELFAKIDSEGTGSLSESQLKEGLKANRPEESAQNLGNMLGGTVLSALLDLASSSESSKKQDMFAQIDSDGDGSVTKSEFVAARPEDVSEEMASSLFDAIDSEGTGALTQSQLEDGMEANAPKGPPPAGGPPPSGGAQSASSEDEETQYDALDTNEDGKVSMSEILAGLESKASEGADAQNVLLNAISDAIKTYASNNDVNLEETYVLDRAA